MKVLLGVSGCIAAYKSCEILRQLQKMDVDVQVVMTEHATKFVGPQTFSALSGHPAKVSNFDDLEDPIVHIRLAEDCDLFLIAPCTGNVLSKITYGIADDLLTTCALAAHDKLALAPAMNVHMYESGAIQENLATLRRRGVKILDPDSGYLACGEVGSGRLAEPSEIAQAAIKIMNEGACSLGRDKVANLDMSGKRVLITAGPTRERIDPVRYISNESSGKMGISLANAAKRRRAEVKLVLGPVNLKPDFGVNVVDVETSEEMYKAVENAFSESDILIFAAAVCDIKPVETFDNKLKKGVDDDALSNIRMQGAIDILGTFASKKEGRYIVGFAAETDNVLENGKAKLRSKNADLIVANEVGVGKTFGKDKSKAWLIKNDGIKELEEMPKTRLADVILDEVCANMC